MSSADMCQCAGCFPARQAADAFEKQMRLRQKIKDLKSRAAKKSDTNTAENKPNE